MISIDKKLLLVLLSGFILFSVSCKKANNAEPEPVQESNILLNEFNEPLVLNQAGIRHLIDLDKDGENDLAFRLNILYENGVTTFYYLADPLKENVHLVASGLLDAYAFPSNAEINDISPATSSKRWSASQGILLEKSVYQSKVERIGMFNGSLKLYLGVRIKKGDRFHYGWVEIRHEEQVDNDRIIIAGAGLYKLSDKAIKAGMH